MTNKYKIINGDSLEELKKMKDNSIENCITDPPWSINFLNKKWDNIKNYQQWTETWAREVHRVLKPGGFLISLCGTRTYHKLLSGIEDAGFEIKDTMTFLYIFASGFPKSHKITNKIDEMMGKESKIVGQKWKDKYPNGPGGNTFSVGKNPDGTRTAENTVITEPVSEEAKKFEGWQTPQLKPAITFIAIAQKKIEKNYAHNMIKYKVGCFNIDACRIGFEDINIHHYKDNHCHRPPDLPSAGKRTKNCHDDKESISGGNNSPQYYANKKGRFPSNLILEEGEICQELDEQSGINKAKKGRTGKSKKERGNFNIPKKKSNDMMGYWPGDNGGGASRFYFHAKASQKEKNYGLEDFEPQPITGRDENQDKTDVPFKHRPGNKCPICKAPLEDGKTCKFHPALKGSKDWQSRCNKCGKKFIGPENTLCKCPGVKDYNNKAYKQKNNHPTIQSISLLKHLISLICYPSTTIIDPFMGSGTTGCSAMDLNKDYNFIGIEKEEHFCKISEARIKYWQRKSNEQIF